jgi:probable rRNA maturation factor
MGGHTPPIFCLVIRPLEYASLVILEKNVVGLSQSALERFVMRARRAAGLRGMVNVLLTSSAAMRSLNSRFRGMNKATDVLSFPSATSSASSALAARQFAGEVAISAEIAIQNSVRLGHPVAKEVKVLVLHGILHLAGFDHERDNGEMAREEAKLRRSLRLPVSLTERDHSTTPNLGKGRAPSTGGRGME